MHYLILGLIALAIVIWTSKKVVAANPANLARLSRNLGGVASLIVAGLLAMRGAMQFAAPLALFGFGLLNGGFSFGGSKKTQGQRSKVVTEFLEMELDHDSGAMRGFVRQGMYEGQVLADLDLDFLIELREECQSDPQSAQLIDAYLDRTEAGWREAAGLNGADANSDDQTSGHGAGRRPGTTNMTRDEAYDVLGLKLGATIEDIQEAHRTLMMKNHPDQGGSTYLAAKINEAKDVLLG